MKKTLCILIVSLFVLSVTAPISVFAASSIPEEIATQANCSHSNYTSEYYYSYIYMNDNSHEAYRTERRQCNNCSDIFYTGKPEPLPLEAHSGSVSYIRSVHVGNYSGHYYVYGGTCVKCNHYYEEKRTASCRSEVCIDPYSLRNSEYMAK